MLIDMRLTALRIRMNSLTLNQTHILDAYIRTLDPNEARVHIENGEIIIKGAPKVLYLVLYRLSERFDIELT